MSENEELRASVASLARLVGELAGLVAHPGTSGNDLAVAMRVQSGAQQVESAVQRPAAA